MKKFTILIGLFFCPLIQAASISDTKITMIMMSIDLDDKVYIKTSQLHPEGSPSCYNSSWSYVFRVQSAHEERMYSALLAAYMSGSKLNMIGSGNCNLHGGIEGLVRIELKN